MGKILNKCFSKNVQEWSKIGGKSCLTSLSSGKFKLEL